MAEKKDGRPASRDGEKGHVFVVERYEKFVPDKYTHYKKR